MMRLTEREFDTIDAIHTLDGGEHTITDLALRMGVTFCCMEQRAHRMRNRGLLEARKESDVPSPRVFLSVSELGEAAFQQELERMDSEEAA